MHFQSATPMTDSPQRRGWFSPSHTDRHQSSVPNPHLHPPESLSAALLTPEGDRWLTDPIVGGQPSPPVPRFMIPHACTARSPPEGKKKHSKKKTTATAQAPAWTPESSPTAAQRSVQPVETEAQKLQRQRDEAIRPFSIYCYPEEMHMRTKRLLESPPPEGPLIVDYERGVIGTYDPGDNPAPHADDYFYDDEGSDPDYPDGDDDGGMDDGFEGGDSWNGNGGGSEVPAPLPSRRASQSMQPPGPVPRNSGGLKTSGSSAAVTKKKKGLTKGHKQSKKSAPTATLALPVPSASAAASSAAPAGKASITTARKEISKKGKLTGGRVKGPAAQPVPKGIIAERREATRSTTEVQRKAPPMPPQAFLQRPAQPSASSQPTARPPAALKMAASAASSDLVSSSSSSGSSSSSSSNSSRSTQQQKQQQMNPQTQQQTQQQRPKSGADLSIRDLQSSRRRMTHPSVRRELSTDSVLESAPLSALPWSGARRGGAAESPTSFGPQAGGHRAGTGAQRASSSSGRVSCWPPHSSGPQFAASAAAVGTNGGGAAPEGLSPQRPHKRVKNAAAPPPRGTSQASNAGLSPIRRQQQQQQAMPPPPPHLPVSRNPVPPTARHHSVQPMQGSGDGLGRFGGGETPQQDEGDDDFNDDDDDDEEADVPLSTMSANQRPVRQKAAEARARGAALSAREGGISPSKAQELGIGPSNIIPIIAIHQESGTRRAFQSVRAAADILGINAGTISRALRHKVGTGGISNIASGWEFLRMDEMPTDIPIEDRQKGSSPASAYFGMSESAAAPAFPPGLHNMHNNHHHNLRGGEGASFSSSAHLYQHPHMQQQQQQQQSSSSSPTRQGSSPPSKGNRGTAKRKRSD